MVDRIAGSLRDGSFKAFMAVGAIAFALIHLFFALTQDSIDWGPKSGIFFTVTTSKILFTVVVLLLTTVSALSFVSYPRSNRVKAGIATYAGTLVAMIVILFVTGPGNLWPIVIVFAAISLAPAFVIGTLLSVLATEFLNRWIHHRD